MAVHVIDTIKPKNNLNFPVVEAIDVFVEGFDNLADAVSHFATDAMIAAINAVLSGKANTSDVNTAVSGLQAQIDQIAQAAGTGSADTEVAQARADADGTTYSTLKARLDADQAANKAADTKLTDEIYSLGNNLDSISNVENYSFYPLFESGNLLDGEPVDATAYSRTANFIDVSKVGKIYFSGAGKNFFIHRYDSNKDFIASAVPWSASTTEYTIDANTKYIKITINYNISDEGLSTFKISYTPYIVSVVSSTAEGLSEKADNSTVTALSNELADLLNANDITINIAYESGNLDSNGEPVASSTKTRTADFIDVSSLSKIDITDVQSAFFLYKYDSSKSFISPAVSYAATTTSLTIPAGTKFVKMVFILPYSEGITPLKATFTPPILTEINGLETEIEDSQITEFAEYKKNVDNPYAGTYNNTNISKGSGGKFVLFDVVEGDVIGFKFTSGTVVMAEFSAFDYEANTMIRVGSTMSFTSSDEITISEGSLYLLVQSKNLDVTKDIEYYKNGLNAVGGVKDVITDLADASLSIVDTDEPCLFVNDVAISGNSKSNVKGLLNNFKYPLTPAWGGEYLAHYYNMLNGRQPVFIALDGDSITAQGYRNTVIDDIMMSGMYCSLNSDGTYTKLYTYGNNGMGSATSQEWVGIGESYDFNGRTVPANGFLEESMAMNPNLLIVAWGINDANKDVSTTTIQQRLETFIANMTEGLQRIRGNTPINGRNAYNRTVDELAIIICSPAMANKGANRENTNWHMYVRKMLADLAREYKCAFVDFSIPTYDIEAFRYRDNIWGDIGLSDSGIHPSQAFTKYYASVLQPLVLPFGFWNATNDLNIPKSGIASNKPNIYEIPVGYRYYCTDTSQNIYCSSMGSRAIGTFTIETIADVSELQEGYFRIVVGSASQRILISSSIITNAIASESVENYLAHYISECLIAKGFESTCENNTFTMKDIRRQPTDTIIYDDGYSGNYSPTNIPITAEITTAGAYNAWEG